MKLRFRVNQAECFRRGIDCDKSIHVLDVNPTELPQEQRDLIADRLDGIDVCQLYVLGNRETVKNIIEGDSQGNGRKVTLVEADTPDFESLLKAVKADAARIQQELKAVPY